MKNDQFFRETDRLRSFPFLQRFPFMHVTLTLLIILSHLIGANPAHAAEAGPFGNKDPGTLIVGTVFPLTGPQSPYGLEAKTGVDLAFEEIQRQRPELAKRIEILHLDDRSTPAGAKLAASSFKKNRVNLVIGSVTNSSSRALAEFADAEKKPLIIPASSHPTIGPPSSYVFRSCFIDSWQGSILSRFALHHLKALKAAVYYNPSDPYAKSIVDEFISSFKKMNGDIISMTSDDHRYKHLRGTVQTWVKNVPDVILFPSKNYHDAIKLTKELQTANLNIPVIGGDRWHPNRKTLSKMSKSSSLYFTTPFLWDDQNPTVQAFVSSFKTRVKRYPSALAAMTYDAMILAADGFARAKTTNADQLRRELRRTRSLTALLGPMNINSKGLAEKTTLVMQAHQSGLELKVRIQPNAAML